MGAKAESLVKMIALWLVAYPATSALVSLILAPPITQAESCSFSDAFLFSMMTMTLTDVPLTAFAPAGAGGIIIAIVAIPAIPVVFVPPPRMRVSMCVCHGVL